MQDEYGSMDDAGETYVYPGDFPLENGQVLPHAQLRYQTYGNLNAQKSNTIVVCHALTGNASLHSWWGSLLGAGKPFDTDKYFIVCCNILGSCYGSTNPTSVNPLTKRPYGKDFPDISVQDTVKLQLSLLQNELKLPSVFSVIGGSFGGMQTVEFAVQGQSYVRSFVPIACNSAHHPWQIAISEVQRQAIYKDPFWDTDEPHKATRGLEIARQIGMISYRTPHGYANKFGRELQKPDMPLYGSQANWKVKSYLEYQGSKFLTRFDPVTYVKLTEQMDSHDVQRGRPDNVLSTVRSPALVLGIDSDVLYPLEQQQELAKKLPNASFEVIHSEDGHDGFLLEQDQVGQKITHFLDRQAQTSKL